MFTSSFESYLGASLVSYVLFTFTHGIFYEESLFAISLSGAITETVPACWISKFSIEKYDFGTNGRTFVAYLPFLGECRLPMCLPLGVIGLWLGVCLLLG